VPHMVNFDKMIRTIIRITPLFVLISLAVFLQACSSADGLAAGDQAPPFNLPSTTGDQVSLTDATNDGPALLYFHMAVG